MAAKTLAVLGLVAVLGIVPGALGAHFTEYRNNAVLHDAIGTVHEPDGLATRVFGPRLEERILDLPPFNVNAAGGARADPPPYEALNPFAADGRPWSDLAPGCTSSDAQGNPQREADGLCGL